MPNSVSAVGNAMSERLKVRAKDSGIDTRVMQIRYAQERLLSRLQSGGDKDRFLVKGGFLFSCRDVGSQRPTEDVDLHDTTELGLRSMAKAIHDAARHMPDEDDGVVYDLTSFKVGSIREGDRPGIRVNMDAYIGNSLVRVKLDICSGDAITPGPQMRGLVSALPKYFDPVVIPTYPWETVLAEKLHAMTKFGMESSRMKDWYDVATIALEENLDGAEVVRAIVATFSKRNTVVDPKPEAFTGEFVRLKSASYAKFVAEMNAPEDRRSLAKAVEAGAGLCLPLLQAAADGNELAVSWEAGSGWTESAPRL